MVISIDEEKWSSERNKGAEFIKALFQILISL